MHYNLTHQTHYQYDKAVTHYHSLACLTPKNLPQQRCTEFSLEVTPTPTEIVTRQDFFGNTVHYFSIHVPHQELEVVARSTVERLPAPPLSLFRSTVTCQQARELFRNELSIKTQLLQFMLPSPYLTWDDEIQDFARDCFPDQAPLYDCVAALCQKIYQTFEFTPNFTTIHTSIKAVLREKKGVCQDFSHLAIACIRSMGFAARYVSGYLETIPPVGKSKLQGSDASHAWIAVFIPEYGWCDFDPTNNLVPQERHITTAWGRDYSDVTPLKGIIFSSGSHTLKVAVDVLPIEN